MFEYDKSRMRHTPIKSAGLGALTLTALTVDGERLAARFVQAGSSQLVDYFVFYSLVLTKSNFEGTREAGERAGDAVKRKLTAQEALQLRAALLEVEIKRSCSKLTATAMRDFNDALGEALAALHVPAPDFKLG